MKLARTLILLFTVVVAAWAWQTPGGADVHCLPLTPAPNTAGYKWKQGMAEYNAYVAATRAATPLQKAQLFAAFVKEFPHSDYKQAAMQAEMTAYAQAGKTLPALAVGKKLLASGATSAPVQLAVYFLSATYLPQIIQPNDPDLQTQLQQLQTAGVCGLKAINTIPRPPQLPAATFAAQQAQAREIFQRGLGFVALQDKNYAAAIPHFQAAARINSKDPLVYYWMGLSQLTIKPPQYQQGIYNLARAAALAPQVGSFNSYFTQVYSQYHGSAQGAAAVKNEALAHAQMPSGYHIVSYADIANAQAQAKYNQEEAQYQKELHALPPADSFPGIVARLKRPSHRAKEWAQIRGVGLELQGTVIHSQPTYIVLAVPETATPSGRPDVRVDLVIRHVVRRGIQVTVLGVPYRYTLKPHFMLYMNKGRIE